MWKGFKLICLNTKDFQGHFTLSTCQKLYKTINNNKQNKLFIMLKRNSFNVLSNTRQLLAIQIWRLSKVRTGWLYIDFGFF